MLNAANLKARIAALVCAHAGRVIETLFLIVTVASIVAIVALETGHPGANAGRPGIRPSAGTSTSANAGHIQASVPLTDAARILANAVRAADDPSVFGLHSYYGITSPGGDQYLSQIWFMSPAHKRLQPVRGPTSIFDGDNVWVYESGRVILQDSQWGGPATGFLNLPFPLRDAEGKFLGQDRVAGRAAYILELSPKPLALSTPSTLLPLGSRQEVKGNGFKLARVWFDSETYIPLKIELVDDAGRAEGTWAFTSFEMNPPVDPAMFAFEIPAGETIEYWRPPVDSEVSVLWQRAAAQVPFPVFEPGPGTLPDWLMAPEGPAVDRTYGSLVSEGYDAKPSPQDTGPTLSGLSIYERAVPTGNGSAQGVVTPSPTVTATPAGVTMPIQLGAYLGQYREQPDAKWIIFERDSTQIWLKGQGKVTRDELVAVAISLQRVLPPPVITLAPPVLAPTIPAPLATAQAIATMTVEVQAQAANRHLGISELAFIDPLHGWYIAAHCTDGSFQDTYCDRPFNTTTDGGQTWRVLGTAPRTAGRILFANAQDGWAYDPDLYSTHDGGKTWVQDTEVAGAPPGSGESTEITSLQLLGGTLAALVDRCYLDPTQRGAVCTDTLRLSTDKGRSWQSSSGFVPKAGPAVRFGEVATQNGPLGWLLVEDFHSSTPESVHLSISHDDGRTWQARPDLPCDAENTTMLEGDGVSSIWLLCADQPGAGSQPKSLYVSADEGRHWELRSSDGQQGEIPRAGYAHSLAVTSPQNAWLALDRGTLYETNDGGRTWAAALPMPGDGSNLGDVLFVDAEHGWWPTLAALYRTTDGGAHWISTSP
jgi:outer membrane lipoprotein-sorting protein